MRTWLLPILLLLALAAWAEPTSVADLFKNRQAADGSSVEVTGTVKNYYEKPDFCSFILFDSGQALSVYSTAHLGLKNNSKATVKGTFYVQKRLADRVFSNVIEATAVTP